MYSEQTLYINRAACFGLCKGVFVCVDLSSDASQTSGAAGQETDEGSDRRGAAGRLRGVRSVSHDEQQSR